MVVLKFIQLLWLGLELVHASGAEPPVEGTSEEGSGQCMLSKRSTQILSAAVSEDVPGTSGHLPVLQAAREPVAATEAKPDEALALSEMSRQHALSEMLRQHEAAVHARLEVRVADRLASDSNIVKDSFAAVGVKLESRHLAMLEAAVHANVNQSMMWDISQPSTYHELVNPEDKVMKLRRNMAMGAMAKGFANLILKLSGPNPHFSPKDVFSTITSMALPVLGYLNPFLGIALTFATTIIQGILGTNEESPMAKLYKRIMKEVEDFVSKALIQDRLKTFKVELAAVEKELELLNDVLSLEAKGGARNMKQAQTIWYMILLKDVSELRMKFWGSDCLKNMRNPKCKQWHEMCIWDSAVHISNLELGLVSQLIVLEPGWGVTLGRRMVEIAKQAKKSVRFAVDACKETRFKDLQVTGQYFEDRFYKPKKTFASFDKYLAHVKNVTKKLQGSADTTEEHFNKIFLASDTSNKTKISLGSGRIFDTRLGSSASSRRDNFWLLAAEDELMRGMWLLSGRDMSDIRLMSSRKVTGGKLDCWDNWHWRSFDGQEGWYDKSKAYKQENLLSAGCGPGWFVRGWYKGSGARLQTLEATKCCKPVGAPDQWGHCEYKTIIDLRIKSNQYQTWHECPAGMMMTGLDRIKRRTGTEITGLYRMKCCSLSYCPAKCQAARPEALRSCKTCVDPKTSRCVKAGENCPVGSLSCSTCDRVISRGCTAKLYAYENFQYGDTHSVYLNESNYCDNKTFAMPLSQRARCTLLKGGLGDIRSIKVEGSPGCQVNLRGDSYRASRTFTLGEYTGSSMKYETGYQGQKAFITPNWVSLTLQCSVIVYNGPGLNNPLPRRLAPGRYNSKELQEMGLMGEIAAFKIEKGNTWRDCKFRLLNENNQLLHDEWKGPQGPTLCGLTPAHVEVGLWD